ncbi:hypothetical protein DICA1_D15346 [Diutina catenulata]
MPVFTRKRLAWSGLAVAGATFLVLNTFPHLKGEIYNWVNGIQSDEEEEEEVTETSTAQPQQQTQPTTQPTSKPTTIRTPSLTSVSSESSAARAARLVLPQQRNGAIAMVLLLLAALRRHTERAHWVLSYTLFHYWMGMVVALRSLINQGA